MTWGPLYNTTQTLVKNTSKAIKRKGGKTPYDVHHIGALRLPYAFEKKVISKVEFSKTKITILGKYYSRPDLQVTAYRKNLKVASALYIEPLPTPSSDNYIDETNDLDENETDEEKRLEEIRAGRRPSQIFPFNRNGEQWEIHCYQKRIKGKSVATLRFLKKGSRKVKKSFTFVTKDTNDIVFSPERNYVAVVSIDMHGFSKIHLIDLSALKKLPGIPKFGLYPDHCANSYLSPNGHYLAILSEHMGILLFDLKRGKQLKLDHLINPSELENAFFSPDNQLFVVTTSNQTAEFFSLGKIH